ncbi:MAG TPA: hypothetical protein VF498_18695 [Anaerolineales bacterium]
MLFNRQKIAILLTLAALLAAPLACKLPGRVSQTPNATPIPVTTQAAQQLKQNLEAAATAIQTDQPVTIVMDEAQLTSIVALELQNQTNPRVTEPQVQLRDGQVTLTGNVQQAGFSLPLKIVLVLSVDAQGKPTYKIMSANLGPLPVPQPIIDQFSAQFDQIMAKQLNSGTNNLAVDQINVADGKMTITGHKR